MKIVLQTMVLFFSACLLTSCYNRIQEYQPYSAFDERMAEARIQEDRPPSLTQDPYEYAEASDDQGSYDNQFNEPPHQAAAPKQFARPSGRGYANTSSSDAEVPFTHSRGPKQPVNIGEL